MTQTKPKSPPTSLAFRQKMVAEFRQSGLRPDLFARSRGINPWTFRKWLYTTPKDLPLPKEEPLRLLPVSLKQNPPPSAPLELLLPDGASLRFPHGTDPAYLQQLRRALED